MDRKLLLTTANSQDSCGSFKAVPPALGLPLTGVFYHKAAPPGLVNIALIAMSSQSMDECVAKDC